MPTTNRISKLRKLAISYRESNNKLIQELWQLNQKILEKGIDTEKNILLTHQKTIQSEADKSLKNYQKTLLELKELEMAEYGHSEIGTSNPYFLEETDNKSPSPR